MSQKILSEEEKATLIKKVIRRLNRREKQFDLSVHSFVPRGGIIRKHCHSCGGTVVTKGNGLLREVCSKCGKPAGEGKFCNNCGGPLGMIKCPKCGAANQPRTKVCGECGNKMG